VYLKSIARVMITSIGLAFTFVQFFNVMVSFGPRMCSI